MTELTTQKAQEIYSRLFNEIKKKIVGQDEIVKLLVTSLFSNGHCLLIGVPGLAKTLLVKSISEVLGLDFNRIQFTPDLMPSDILGSEIIKNKGNEISFEYQAGPIFTNLLLADEINRTPPKTQAALLEAMQEKKVTIGGRTRNLAAPFLVVATQNPIEQEGTYPLPEAQLDRFMFSLNLDYPSILEEREIVKQTTGLVSRNLQAVVTKDEILSMQDLVRAMPVSDHVINYAVALAAATRPTKPECAAVAKKYLDWGVGPRASQFLILGAKAYALIDGRSSPAVSDIKHIADPILRHRIVVNYRATGEGVSAGDVINQLIESVKEDSYDA